MIYFTVTTPAPNPAAEERRYAPRVRVDSPACIWSGSLEVRGRVVDLSARGVAIAAPATVELERFVRLRAVLVPGTSPIDVDAIVLRRERRGPVTHWGLQIHDIPSYVLSQIVDFVNTELERVKVKTPAAIERAVIGEDDDIRVIYDQALSQLAS